MARKPGGRTPRKPADTKLRAPKPKPDTLAPQSLRETVLAFAAIAWTYQNEGAWEQPTSLRSSDELLLREVASLVRKHRLRTPSNAKRARLTDHTLRLGYLRWEFERILEAALREKDTPDRDQRIASSLVGALADRGLVVRHDEIGPVLMRLIRAERSVDNVRLRDWVRGPNGVRNTAGRILEGLGVKLGWLGTSGGNTNRLREIVQKSDGEFKARTADQLQLTAFLLSALGVPSRTLPWVSFLVTLATRGTELTVRFGTSPPAIPSHPSDLRRANPTTFLDMSKEDFEAGFRHAWESFQALRTDISDRFPSSTFSIPDEKAWISLWQQLSMATLPLAKVFELGDDEHHTAFEDHETDGD